MVMTSTTALLAGIDVLNIKDLNRSRKGETLGWIELHDDN
tara:strand:- start:303 stop:422 length:120 start_codon:yes stop_codon:yes gene_type:complete